MYLKFVMQKAARVRWLLLWHTAVGQVQSDIRRKMPVTVASRRALCTRASLRTQSTESSFASSSWLQRLCFWWWRMAVIAWSAEADVVSDLESVSLASRQLRALRSSQLLQ